MAEVTVDKLRVEVEATAKGANQVFQELEKRLKALKSSATGFNTSGLTNLTNALNKVATSLDNISSKINTVNNTTATPKVNTSGVTSSEKKIDSSISKIRESLAGLTAYGNAAMSGDSSALTSFDRRVTSIQSAIDVLKSKIESLGDTTVEVNAVDYYEDKIKATRDAIDELLVKEQELAANNIGGDEWDALQEKISETRDKLDELISKQGEFAPDEMIKVDGLEDEKAALAEFQSQLDETSADVHSQVDGMSGLEITIGTTLANLNLSQLASQAAKTTKKLLTMAGSAVKSAISGLASTISKLASSLSKVSVNTDKATGIFKKGFTTIMKYGFGIRSLYVLFRRLRQAVKDSFVELQNSGAYYETTRANIEALKSSLSILKYQFGAAFETIFNTVAPALQTFINYLISAMNTLSAFIAKLTGKSTYSKAVKATSDIAGNAGSAADSAKEMAKQLQGFDELNNLSGNSSGGSGGGGGSSGDSSGVTYVTESVDNALGDFTNALSDSINKGDWQAVGTLLSNKLKEMMDKIPWNDIYAKANSFGTNLALFLKGLITEDTFKSLGSTIASALKTALIALKGFSDTLNEVDEKTGKTGWQQFGDSLSAGIKGFVEENPLQLAAETFNSLANGILDGVLSAITSLLDTSEGKSTMQTIAEHIATAIGTVDTKGFGEKLGGIASGIANAVYVLVSNKDTWTNLGTKIADGINGFFSGMSQTNSSTGLTGWQALGKDIENTLTGIGTTLVTALKGVDWVAVGQGIADMIKTIDWSQVTFVLDDLLTAIKNAIIGVLKGAEIDGKDIVLTLATVTLTVAAIGAITLAATITKAAVSALLTEAIKALFKSGGVQGAINVFSEAAPLMLNIAAVTLGILAAATIGWQFGKTLGEFIAVWLANKGIISKDAEGEYSAIMNESLVAKFKDIVLSVKEGTFADAWTTMWYEWFEPEFAEIESLGVTIKGFALSVASSLKGFGTAWTDFWADYFEPAFSEIENFPITIKGWAISIGQGVQTFKEAWNAWFGTTGDAAYEMSVQIKTAFEDTKETLKTKWNNIKLSADDLKEKIKTSFEDTKESLATKWNNIKTGVTDVTAQVKADLQTSAATLKSWGASYKRYITAQWKSKTAKLKAAFAKGTSWDTLAKYGNKFKEHITDKWKSKAATMSIKLGGIVEKLSDITNNVKTTFMSLYNSWKGEDATFSINIKGMLLSTLSSWAEKIKTLYENWVGKDATFSLDFSARAQDLKDWVNTNVIGKVNTAFSKVPILNKVSIPYLAEGGIAKKATNAIIGEAGTEAVVPLERNTGWLKKISNMLIDGMSKVSQLRYNPYTPTLSFAGASGFTFDDTSSRDNNTAIMEQNRLLAEQNRLLEQILQKPTGISKRDVFEANRSEANNYFNRTGNSPFLF